MNGPIYLGICTYVYISEYNRSYYAHVPTYDTYVNILYHNLTPHVIVISWRGE